MDLNSGKQSLENCSSMAEAMELFSRCVENQSFMSIHDQNGAYIKVSDSYSGITGYCLEHVMGDSAYGFFHPDDLKTVLKSHAYVTLKTDLSEVEVRFRKSNGTYVKLKSYAKQVIGEDNKMVIVVLSHVQS